MNIFRQLTLLTFILSPTQHSWAQFSLSPFDSGGSTPVTAELISELDSIQPGKPFTVGVKFTMDPAWHIYWVNPGFTGLVTEVSWELPEGFTAGPLQYPVPHSFTTAGLGGYGYEEETVLLAEITPPANLNPGDTISIKAKASWQQCDDKVCIPKGSDIAMQLTSAVNPGGNSADADLIQSYREKLPTYADWPISATLNSEADTVTVVVEHRGQIKSADEVHLYPAIPKTVDPTEPPQVEFTAETYKMTLAKNMFLKGELPEVMSAVIHSEAGFGDASLGKSVFVTNDPNPTLAPAETTGPSAPLEATEEQLATTDEGWGYWLQRPAIVTLLAGLMLLIALNLFGVFEVGIGLTGAGGSLTQQSGLAGSFFSGALATVLATPCTAPFMGLAITYAIKSPAAISLLVFTALGLGMALPYLILSRFPGLVQKLPKPGPWMETFKQAMGFPMLAVVVWLITVLANQVGSTGFPLALVSLTVLALGAWWYGRFATMMNSVTVRRVAWGASAALLVTSVVLACSSAKDVKVGETRDVEAEIAALQAEGKSVFVDFTATWCATCQVNKAAMHSDEVEAAFEANNVTFLEVDWTLKDSKILEVLQKYGSQGVPLYLLFSPEETEPMILDNVLTKGKILSALSGDNIVKPKVDPSLLTAIISALFGGLILNIMPCVFPVITLKIMGFVNQAGEDKKQIWHHGLAFAAGVLVFFWILAIFLITARSAVA